MCRLMEPCPKKYGFSEPLRNIFKFSELKVQIFLYTDWANLAILGDLEYTKSNSDLEMLQAWKISRIQNFDFFRHI